MPAMDHNTHRGHPPSRYHRGTPPSTSKPLPRVTPRKAPPRVMPSEQYHHPAVQGQDHNDDDGEEEEEEDTAPPSVPVKPYPPRLTLNGSSGPKSQQPFSASFEDDAGMQPSSTSSSSIQPAPFTLSDPQFFPRKYRSRADRPESTMSTSTTYSARAAVVQTASRQVLKKAPVPRAKVSAVKAPPPAIVPSDGENDDDNESRTGSASASDYDPDEPDQGDSKDSSHSRRRAPPRLDLAKTQPPAQPPDPHKVQTPLSATSSRSLFFNGNPTAAAGPSKPRAANSILSLRRPSADRQSSSSLAKQRRPSSTRRSKAPSPDTDAYFPGEWAHNQGASVDALGADAESDSDPNLSKLAAFSFPASQPTSLTSTPLASSSGPDGHAGPTSTVMGARRLKWKEAVQLARLQERQAHATISSAPPTMASTPSAISSAHARGPSTISSFSLGGFSASNSAVQLSSTLAPIQSVDLTPTTKDTFLSALFASQAAVEVASSFTMPPFTSVEEFEAAKKELRRLEQRLVDKKNRLRTMKRLRGAVGKLARTERDRGMSLVGASSPLLGASLNASESGSFAHRRGPSTASSSTGAMARSRSRSIIGQQPRSAAAAGPQLSSQSTAHAHAPSHSISSNTSAMTFGAGNSNLELESATEQVDRVIDEMHDLELRIGELRMRIREHVARVLSWRCEDLERRVASRDRTDGDGDGDDDDDEHSEAAGELSALEEEHQEIPDLPRRRGAASGAKLTRTMDTSDEARIAKEELTALAAKHEALQRTHTEHQKQSEEMLRDHEAQRRDHQRVVDQLKSEASAASASAAARNVGIDSDKERRLEAQVAALQGTSSRLESELQAERAAKTRLEKQAADLQTSPQRTEGDLQFERAAKKHIEEQIADLQEAAQRAEDQLQSERSQKRDLQAQVVELQQFPKRLEGELQAGRSAIQQLEGQVSTLQTSAKRLESELQTERKDKQRLEDELQSERSAKQRLEDELQTERDAKQRFENEVSTMRDSKRSEDDQSRQIDSEALRRLEVEKAHFQEAVRKLEKEKSTSDDTIRQLRDEQSQSYDSVSRLETEKSASQDTIRKLEGDKAALQGTARQLETQMSDLQSAHRQVQDVVYRLEGDKARAEKDAQDSKSQHAREAADLSAQSSNLSRELSSVQAQIQSHQASARESEDKFRALELAVSAERRIMSERDALFHAFEARLLRAEETLREQDKRCAALLGKAEGREELDDFLAKIRGGSLAKKDKTAGQDIDDLLTSLREHIEDLADELSRRVAGAGAGSTYDTAIFDTSEGGNASAAMVQQLEDQLETARHEIERLNEEVEAERKGAQQAAEEQRSTRQERAVEVAAHEARAQEHESMITRLQSHNDELRNEIESLKGRLVSVTTATSSNGTTSHSMESFDDGQSSLVKVPGSESDEGDRERERQPHRDRQSRGGSGVNGAGGPAASTPAKSVVGGAIPFASSTAAPANREKLHATVVSLLRLLPSGLDCDRRDYARLAGLLRGDADESFATSAGDLSFSFASHGAGSSSKQRKKTKTKKRGGAPRKSSRSGADENGKATTPSKSPGGKVGARVAAWPPPPAAQSHSPKVSALRRRFSPPRQSLSSLSSSSESESDGEEDERAAEQRQAHDAWLLARLEEIHDRARSVMDVARDVTEQAVALEKRASDAQDAKMLSPVTASKMPGSGRNNKAASPAGKSPTSGDVFGSGQLAAAPQPHHISRPALSRLRPLNTTAFLSARGNGAHTPSPSASPLTSPSRALAELNADMSPRTAQEVLHERNLDSSLKSLAARYGEPGNGNSLGLEVPPLAQVPGPGRRSASARAAPRTADSAWFSSSKTSDSSSATPTPQRSITLGLSTPQLINRIRDLEAQVQSLSSAKKSADRVLVLEERLAAKEEELKQTRAEVERVREEEMLQKARLLEELNDLQMAGVTVREATPTPSPASMRRHFKPLPSLLG